MTNISSGRAVYETISQMKELNRLGAMQVEQSTNQIVAQGIRQLNRKVKKAERQNKKKARRRK